MPCEADLSHDNPSLPLKKELPEGVPALSSLYLYIAGVCNLACKHCWIKPGFDPHQKSSSFMKLEYIAKAIQEGKPMGLSSMKLTGGEPTLHPQFREIVSMIAEARLSITIETNGTLIDQELARFLKQHNVVHVSVSLDGSDALTHDTLRAVAGSHEKAIAGIKALVSEGFRPQAICTLHKGNASQIDQVVALAESLGCGSVKFNHAQPMGRGEDFSANQGMDVAEIIEIHKRIEKQLIPQSKISISFDIPFAFYSIRKLSTKNLGRCCILHILGMLASGDLSLCGIGVNVPELVYGHIAKDRLENIWCHAPGLLELRAKIPSQLEGICGQCLHRDLCMGECVANSYHRSGRLNAAYWFCDTAEKAGLFPLSRKK